MVMKVVDDPDERRDGGRHQVHSLMPLKMALRDSGASFPCRIDDVSADGLGILSGASLPAGAAVVFETLEGRFNFVVAWCREVERREFRCGLMLTDEGVDLQAMFSRFIPIKTAG